MPWLDQGYTVLTPTRRLSRAVIAAYDRQRAEAGESAWASPAVLPVDQWFENRWSAAVMAAKLPALQLLDVSRCCRLWQDIIESESSGFTLLGPGAAARRAQQARSTLRLWHPAGIPAELEQAFSFGEDTAAFWSWLQAFDQQCAQRGLICPEDAQAALLDAPVVLENERLLLLDVDELPPLQEAILEKVADVQRLEAAPRCENMLPVQSFQSERDELRAIAAWCRQHYEKQESGLSERIAVVLQDMQGSRELLEMFLRREFDCLTSRYESLPVNFATGLTLERVPLVRDALHALALGGTEWDREDLAAALRSRFTARLNLVPDDLDQCLEALRTLGPQRLPQRVVRQVLEPLSDGSVEMPWERSATLAQRGRWLNRARPPSQWIEPFRAQLSAWGWVHTAESRAPLDSLEYQQLDHWLRALDALAGYDLVSGELDYTEALALLRGHCAQTLFQPQTPDSAIQVLGPLETTGLSFSDMWVAGMSADNWPAAPRPNPFLPNALQRDRRMPHCDIDWERQLGELRLQRWRGSALRLHSSYVAIADEAPVTVSPLLGSLPQLLQPPHGEADARWSEQAATHAVRPVALQNIPLGSTERAAGHVSTAALQEMAQCTFQAFAARRLGVEAPSETGPGLSPGERGSMLHDALYRVFAEVRESTVLAQLDSAALGAIAATAAKAACTGLDPLRRDIVGTAVLDLETQRLGMLLVQWLELEQARPVGFTVIGREENRELLLGPLTVRMRLDRIDELDSGDRVIIDYKSGRSEPPARWFDSPPQLPQLPLYALADDQVSGVAYASVRPGDPGFSGVGDSAFAPGVSDNLAKVSRLEELGDMSAARRYWQESLSALAEAFVAGEVQVDPTVDACRYCQRHALCRLAEQL